MIRKKVDNQNFSEFQDDEIMYFLKQNLHKVSHLLRTLSFLAHVFGLPKKSKIIRPKYVIFRRKPYMLFLFKKEGSYKPHQNQVNIIKWECCFFLHHFARHSRLQGLFVFLRFFKELSEQTRHYMQNDRRPMGRCLWSDCETGELLTWVRSPPASFNTSLSFYI